MPFRKLPHEVQDTLAVHSAWLESHSERLDDHSESLKKLQAASSNGEPRRRLLGLHPIIVQLITIGFCFATALGYIKPEQLIKILPVLLKILLGV